MNRLTPWFVCPLVLALGGGTLAAPPEPGVALTVYNNDFAVVRETRKMQLPAAQSTVQFVDVAKQIDPTSVHFESLTDPTGTTVIEQNYEYDLVSADKLLDKYIDRRIAVMTEDGSRYAGTLLSFDGRQIVLQGADQLYMVQRPNNVKNIEFGKLPEGLLTRPTLVWQVATNRPGEHVAQVTYQTSGLSWSADYNVVLNEDDTEMNLSGWVTLNNQSGGAYRDARVKLIAGDVRKVQPERPKRFARAVALDKARGGAPEAGFAEQSFFEYHLYTLGRTTTINENQVKQIELLTAADVPVTKRYVFEPGGRYWHRRYGEKDEYKVNIFIELKNDEQSNLGMPLPKGKVRVYKASPAPPGRMADLEFVGEDRIDHTPRDEEVRLYIGDAFDLVGEKKIVDQKQANHWRQQKIEITLRNHKDQNATVRVREHLGYGNWEISDNSHPFTKDDAKTIEFDVPVPTRGESTLTYTVDYRW